MKSKLFQLIDAIKNEKQWMSDLEYFLSIPSNEVNEEDITVAKRIFSIYRDKSDWSETRIRESVQVEVDKQSWNRTKNKIHNTILRYLRLRLIERHPFNAVLLGKFFYDQDMGKFGNSLVTKVYNQLDQKSIDINDSLYKYLLSEVQTEQEKHNRVGQQGLIDMEKDLDLFYMEKKLRCMCEGVNRSKITGDNYEVDEQFLNWVKYVVQQPSLDKLALYYYLLLLLSEEQESYYEQIKKRLIKIEKTTIDESSLKEFYTYLLNYCSHKIISSPVKYAQEYLYLIREMESRDLLLENGTINVFLLINWINVALIANDIATAWHFLNQYGQSIAIEGNLVLADVISLRKQREHILLFFKAIILFQEEKYQACSMQLDINLKFADPHLQLSLWLLNLKLTIARSRVEKMVKYKEDALKAIIKNTQSRIKRQKQLNTRKKDMAYRLLDAFKALVNQEYAKVKSIADTVDPLNKSWLIKVTALLESDAEDV